MPLTIDELRWLYLSSALDSLAASSGRTSPPSLRSERQRKLSQSLPTLALGENVKLSDFDTASHFRSAAAPASIHKSSSLVFAATSAKCSSWHRNSSSSPQVKSPRPATSPCQEWIYRRPNKSAAPCHGPSPGTSSPRRIRHYKSQDQFSPYPESRAASYSYQDANPFWSTLRPRPMLKARPSRTRLVISPPFKPPLPTISPNTSETTFRSEKMDTSPLRTPSITSIASTASSTSAPNTPTVASFAYAPRQHPLRNRPPNRHLKSSSDYSPLPSSFSPSKSILARSSSVSTSGSHTTFSTGVPSPTKSVKFVETPMVHYASRGYWDLESLKEVEASQSLPDIQMGMDVEEMDLGGDDLALSRTMKRELEIAREAMCATPTLDTERGRVKGLQRIISLKRRTSLPTKRDKSCLQSLSRRPTISGPYVLGTFQGASAEDGWPPSSPSLADHSPLQRSKGSQPTRSLSLNRVYLRSAPSLESVRSTRSAAARSLRRVSSINGVNNARGVRAWLEKIRLG